MVADVPVGLFLSGGLDSTTVGYFMRRHSDDVHSFSIGFEEHDFDESSHAKAAARSLGTTHHLEVMSQQRLLEIVPRIPEVLDEPMGDQSILPTYLLSEFTRRDVTVALGGDGSDELLMGYNSFRPLKAAWKLDWVPRPVRSAAAAAAKRSPNVVAGRHLRGVEFARRIEKTPLERLLSHLGSFKGDARGVLSGEARSALPPSVYSGVESSLVNGASGGLGPADQTVFAYARGYLQEDILVKVDRASMASSLEVRTPFLDPNVVELAISAPPALRHRGLTGKYLLRRLMRGRIPSELIDRPKVGFGVPINAWLRGPLAPMLREHLSRDRIESGGYFHPSTVERLLDEHLSGTANRGNELWLLLQFEAWRDRWLS
jgi:asparagine synthase (glutamine-hydrolysing)